MNNVYQRNSEPGLSKRPGFFMPVMKGGSYENVNRSFIDKDADRAVDTKKEI
jgi:hypothetical protein